jgi:cholesterol oxidase
MIENPDVTDVIVIGSGFGGSISASKIAEAGFSVKLLERGPWRDSVPVRSMNVGKRSPFPTGKNFLLKGVRTLRNNKLPGGKITLNKQGFFEMHVGMGLNILCSSNVGGGSHAYSGINMKPPEPGYWDGIAEGLSDAKMDIHYRSVFTRMGSSIPSEEQNPGSVRKRFGHTDVLETGQSDTEIQMGFLLPKQPGNPQEVVNDEGIARREAIPGEDGNLGSPGGGKTSLDFAYLARAMKQGLDVLDLREVLSIRPSPEGAPARYRVNIENHHTGDFESHYAEHVFVAAGTVNTLHLLLRSRDAEDGLGGMPRLGQQFGGNGDFMAYWNLNDTSRDLSKTMPARGWIKLKRGKEEQGNRPMPLIVDGALPNPDNLPLPRWLKKKFRHGAFIAGMGPDAQDGTVSLEKGKLKIDYNPENSEIFAQTADEMDEISEKTGRKIYYINRPTTVHPTGGACIGRNEEEGVVDADGEVFGHPGLFVADAAALPKPPGGPPSMTIAAWSDHVAERFIANHTAVHKNDADEVANVAE